MNGGGGYLPQELGEMTLDQLYFRLCDLKVLKRKEGNQTEKIESLGAVKVLKPDKEGRYKGRTAKGELIKAKITGKSKARRIMEEVEAKKKREKRRKRRKH